MLCLARSERAGTPVDVRMVDAAEEASRISSYYGPLAEDGGVSVKVDGYAGGRCGTHVVSARVEQAAVQCAGL